MSDSQQGATWWRASDGRWYPPELHPQFAELCADVASAYPVDSGPSPVTPGSEATPPTASAPPVGGLPPGQLRGSGDLPPERPGSYWFSPPSAIAIVGFLASLTFGVLAPGRLGFFLFLGFSALWTARAVMRWREGYGATVMTATAVLLALVTLVAWGMSFFSALTDPLLPTPSPTLPEDADPQAGDRIAWYQAERGWCFDLDGRTRAGELSFVTIASCDEPHDAQALTTRRDGEVLTRVGRALADAAAGSVDPSSSAPLDESMQPRSDDPLRAPMTQWCEELSSDVLAAGAPESLTVVPIYASTVASGPHPVLVCVLVAGDGGVLTRDFTR